MMKIEPGAKTHRLHVAAIVAVIAELAFACAAMPVFATLQVPGAQAWTLAFVLYSSGTVALCIWSASKKTGWTRFILPTIAAIAALYPSALMLFLLLLLI